MIVHLTTLKTAPKNVSNIVKLLYRDEIVDLGRQFNLLSMLTVESKLEPGRVLSASTWESVEAAQVALSNPAYAQLVKEMAPYFTGQPERSAFKVLRYVPLGVAVAGMFLNSTNVKVKPDNVEKLVEILHNDSTLNKSKDLGMQNDIWALESQSEPGMIHSISIWNTPEAAQKVFADPFYADLLGKMKHLFIAAPERFGFTVLDALHLKELAPA